VEWHVQLFATVRRYSRQANHNHVKKVYFFAIPSAVSIICKRLTKNSLNFQQKILSQPPHRH
jgi:hypothetical protein